MKLVRTPYSRHESIRLAAYDFRKPGQLDPWRAKKWREQQPRQNLNSLFGVGLAQQQQSIHSPANIQAQLQGSRQAQSGSPLNGLFGGLY